MAIRQLTESEFAATMVPPMRRLEPGEMQRPIPLKQYVKECIDRLKLPTSLKKIEIEHVYLAGDRQHSHVMFSFGEANRYLVLVIDHQTESVLGYHMLDMNQAYGVDN